MVSPCHYFIRGGRCREADHVADSPCLDDADAARRKYKKDLDFIKPDLESYNKQKEIALGLAAGTLTKAGSSSSALTTFDPSGGAVQVRIFSFVSGVGHQ